MAEQYALAEGQDKLSRSHYKGFIDSTFGGETPDWFKVGQDNDDLSMDLNPSTSTTKNVWDETEVTHEGYEPSMSVSPYYARKNDSIYPQLKNIAMNRLSDDSCRTKFLEVIVDKKEAPFDAWIEDCMIIPQSYGGGPGGVAIPFDIQLCGNRVEGTVTITDKKPVFTPKASG